MANEVELEKVSKSVFGITSRRYRQMATDEIVPTVVKGKIDFIAASKALIAYYRRLAEGQGSLSLSEERKELTAIKKEREKLKLETERKNLVPFNEAVKWVSLLVVECKAALWNFPRRMAEILAVKLIGALTDAISKLNPEISKILLPIVSSIGTDFFKDVEEDIRKGIRQILEELAKGARIKKGKKRRNP